MARGARAQNRCANGKDAKNKLPFLIDLDIRVFSRGKTAGYLITIVTLVGSVQLSIRASDRDGVGSGLYRGSTGETPPQPTAITMEATNATTMSRWGANLRDSRLHQPDH